ncbi:MAG: AAA family ATPase, partial [Acidobacteriota bacterium]
MVFRSRAADGTPRIVKLLAGAHPAPERIAWFRREYEILRRLADVDGVVGAQELHCEQHRWFLVLEDVQATSLDRLWGGRPMPPDVFLPLAVRLTEILGDIHHRRVIHKDLNPSNLVWNPETEVVQVIDFGISSILRRESPSVRDPSRLEGTLAYMAPEQTGRTGRVVDERSDFYSLGATFYELLTGRSPFEGDEPLDVVHGHLARMPESPAVWGAEISPRLAAITLRLLAKNPDDRYRSCQGLRHDLLACRDASMEDGGTASAAPFVLGRRDVPTKLRLPQKLYGREDEQRRLLAAFDEVVGGGRAWVLVTGYAGVGKSSLVRELLWPVSERGGFFIGGKFGQLERHEPYAPWLSAFGELLRQILGLDEEALEGHRRRLAESLGRNARVVADVLPELAILLGATEPVPELGPVETRNRFRITFQRFVSTVARKEHPLVVFLDDLQWADGASLDLLGTLLSDPEAGYLMVVGAYRDNEVHADHPLRRKIELARRGDGAELHELSLEPLTELDVGQMLADTFITGTDAVGALAQQVRTQSGGNPHFLGLLLDHLASEDLLRFDTDRCAWTWSLDEIASCGVTDNVVDLLASRVRSLPPSTRRVLELASCVGDVFDLETLSVTAETAPRTAAKHLAPSLVAELVVPLDERYKLAYHQAEGLETSGIAYRFVHDRVRQAAYSLIDEAERGQVHWRVGQQLWSQASRRPSGDPRFDIVDQLSRGLEGGVDPGGDDARATLAELFLRAGRGARAAAAHEPALHYFRHGIRLLTSRPGLASGWPSSAEISDGWRRQPELCLDLFVAAAEASFMDGSLDDVDLLLKVAHSLVASEFGHARLSCLGLEVLFARGDAAGIAREGLAALARLGLEVRPDHLMEEAYQVMAEVTEALASYDLEALAELEPAKDPLALAKAEILHHLVVLPNLQDLVPLAAAHLVLLSLKHGLSDFSPRGFGALGMTLCSLGEVETGISLGRLALELSQRFERRDTPFVLMLNIFYRFTREEPLADVLDHWREAYE